MHTQLIKYKKFNYFWREGKFFLSVNWKKKHLVDFSWAVLMVTGYRCYYAKKKIKTQKTEKQNQKTLASLKVKISCVCRESGKRESF